MWNVCVTYLVFSRVALAVMSAALVVWMEEVRVCMLNEMNCLHACTENVLSFVIPIVVHANASILSLAFDVNLSRINLSLIKWKWYAWNGADGVDDAVITWRAGCAGTRFLTRWIAAAVFALALTPRARVLDNLTYFGWEAADVLTRSAVFYANKMSFG